MALQFFVFIILLLPTGPLALWPIPRVLTTGSTAIRLSSTFDIRIDVPDAPTDLKDAVARSKLYLENDKLQRLVVGRGAADSLELRASKEMSSLTISLDSGAIVKSIAEEAVRELTSRSDEYTLSVPDDGSPAVLKANSTLGLLRGLTTFGQLWYEYDGQTYTLEAPIEITDYPAFPYRGFMLDTARNFFPVEDIERTLDAMSWVKINTLHWHVVDSQSFPLEVQQFPELSTMGAYEVDEIYKTSDVQRIVAYGAARGIDILLEIDSPAHTTAIGESHPEFIACNDATPWSDYASEPPAGQLRFVSPSVVNFTSELISSVAATLPSTLFSTGGDELNLECYAQDEQTQAALDSSGQTLDQALNIFVQSLHKGLLDQGKTPVVKQEIALDYNVTLSNETIVLVWISSENASAIADRGFRLIQQPSDFFYLDCGAGAWLGNDISGVSWCDPFKTWQKSYSFDPLANLTEEQSKLVLGGQNMLWTEQSSPENLDSIAWPRAASSAEVFWTGATLPDGSPRNVTFALPRLHDLRFRMLQRGVKAIPLQPKWCALRPGACDA